ncbi:hypothetical protein [Fonticella tunisiensis]|uniref:Transporter n=1 Tax=Fonticella tunisiensis TaxID=1096341 RepID=A0A4R7KB88_9CLOT|nr:hypothetical protein [Fonticella tunisiensis]TDT51887.1 hypothetical protein EDD71_11722 [Fonticella tunisiensis]
MYPDDFEDLPICYYCRFGPGPYVPPPQGPPFGPGTQPGPGQGAQPPGPPPAVTPQQTQLGVQAVSPGSLRFCLFKYTYVWLRNGRSFWIWPTYIRRGTIAGWRWSGRRWVYFGLDVRRIVSFVCY